MTPTKEQIEAAREALRVVSDEDWTASFEKAAEEFRRETGYMAPGKDVPAMMNPSDEYMAARRPAWESWSRRRTLAVNTTLLAALDALAREPELLDKLDERYDHDREQEDVINRRENEVATLEARDEALRADVHCLRSEEDALRREVAELRAHEARVRVLLEQRGRQPGNMNPRVEEWLVITVAELRAALDGREP